MFLRKYRKLRNITQVELASHLGVRQSSITDWETGRANPSIETILKIAEYLKITTDELLIGEKGKISTQNNDNSVILEPYAKELLDNFEKLSVKSQIKLISFSLQLIEEDKSNLDGGKLSTSQIS